MTYNQVHRYTKYVFNKTSFDSHDGLNPGSEPAAGPGDDGGVQVGHHILDGGHPGLLVVVGPGICSPDKV